MTANTYWWVFYPNSPFNIFTSSIIVMKFFITFLIVLFSLQASAQSPGLTINASMDSTKSSIRYKIEMKLCEPVKKSDRGNMFSHDTSTIKFDSLFSKDISCGQYFDNGMTTPLYGKEEDPVMNKFQFSNQVFAWEKLLVFRITSPYTRGWWPPMYVVVAMPYKSFRTIVDLTDIEFKSGQVIVVSKPDAIYSKSFLSVRQSFRNLPGVAVKTSRLKKILEQK